MPDDTTKTPEADAPKTEPIETIARGDEQHGYKYMNVYGPGSPRQGQPLSPLHAFEKPEYDSEEDAQKALEERKKVEAEGPPAKDAPPQEEKKDEAEEKKDEPKEGEKKDPKGWIRRRKEDE